NEIRNAELNYELERAIPGHIYDVIGVFEGFYRMLRNDHSSEGIKKLLESLDKESAAIDAVIVKRESSHDRGSDILLAYYGVIKGIMMNISETAERAARAQEKARDQSSASPIKAPPTTGGIDFRALPLAIQPMGSFKGLNFKLPPLTAKQLAQIDIDQEVRQLHNMASSGIRPSGQRIKELIAACVQKKEISAQADNLLLCLIDIYKLEEENGYESEPELREALVIVDTAA
ncbi:MAG: hypothetical protein WC478_04950, partial [Candidatus Omnitrophota bacterium]